MRVMGIASGRVQRCELVRRRRWTPTIAAIVALLAVAVFPAVAAPAAKAAPPTTCIWVGGGGDGAWSNPDNWQDGVVPTNGANLVFAGTLQQNTYDDIDMSDLDSVGTVTFDDPGFVVYDDGALHVRGIDNETSSGTTTWNATIWLDDDLMITTQAGGTLVRESTLQLNSHLLTVKGAGLYDSEGPISSPGSIVVAGGRYYEGFNNAGNFQGDVTVIGGATLSTRSGAGLGGSMTLDAGGTLAGGGLAENVDVSGALVPDDSPPAVLSDVGDETWQPGGSLTCAVTGTNDFDQSTHLYVNDDLAIDSTVDSPFTICLTTPLGDIADFDNTQSYSWDVAKAWGDDGISGYEAGNVVLDTSGVQADLGGGTFSLRETGGYTSDIWVDFTPAPKTYTLAYTAGAGGTISGDSPQTVDAGDDGSQVTAVPDTGYHFTGWSDGMQTATRTDTDVADDITVTADFAANPTTPPTTTVSGVPDGWSRVPVTLHFTATPAAGCTVGHTEYRYGTLDWTTGTSCPIDDQGVTVVSYRSVDNYGNVETTKTCTVRIDGVRPVVSGGSAIRVRRGAKATFAFRLADNCATSLGCKLIITQYGKTKLVVDCGTQATGKLIHVTARIALPAGHYSWRVSAVDPAGNHRRGPIHALLVSPPKAR